MIYVLPATPDEVPNVRRLGMHWDGERWVEHICLHVEPCNRSDCTLTGLLPRPAPRYPLPRRQGRVGSLAL